jgi:subtilisin family serine protease
VVVASLLLVPAAAPARAELCVVVDPVVTVGCRVAPAKTATTAAPKPTDATGDPVRLSSTRVEYDPRAIAVRAEPSASRRALAAAFAAAGVEVEQQIPSLRTFLVRVAPGRQDAAVRELRSSAAIARAGPDIVSHLLDTNPNDSQWPAQSGLRVVGLPRAWDLSRGSSRLVVAVIDTGVDPAQPDLRGALVRGANFVDPSEAPNDDHGHGTAVAGVIAARANNREGMAGVCWFCLVMPVKVLGSDGSGDDTRIAAGIVWAVDSGARVLNLSLGGPGHSPELDAALAYATAKGALVVAAAGNSGTTVPFFPAADGNVLSVAATKNDDHAYSWSNYGSWVDVAAPGCNVAPLRASGYGLFCGTSSATPIVSGLAALAFAEQPGATAAAVRAAIERSTTPVSGFVRFGRVEAPETLSALVSSTRRVSAVRRGTLTAKRPSWSFDVASVPGSFRASLRLAGDAIVRLTLVSSEDGTVLAQTVGRRRIRLNQPVLGPVRVDVRALRGVPVGFSLSVAYGAAG